VARLFTAPDTQTDQIQSAQKSGKTQKSGYFEAYGMILVLTELLVVCKTNGRV
jgi:hypothetical protein